MRCDDCQSLLLDHLYGLLDGPEGAAVDAHLADCPACTAAGEQAGRARGLFARAARLSFPNVRFTPPADAEPAGGVNHTAPAVPSVALPPASRPRRPRAAWASVAAVLVLIPGTVLPVRYLTGNYDDARAAAAEAAARYGQARAERDRIASAVVARRSPLGDDYENARARHDGVLAEWVASGLLAAHAERTRRVAVEVDRPAAVQPGAPNEVVVVVKDARGLPAGRIEAQVRDDQGNVLARERIDPARPDPRHPVKIPAAAWAALKPQSELYLNVVAIDDAPGAAPGLIDRVRLFGPVYATMLVTDKATYRPGERVFFRSLTLDRVTFRPPDGEQVLRFELRRVDPGNPAGVPVGKLEEVGTTSAVRVTDGRVEPVPGPDGRPVRGVGCGAFVLPATLADGDYTLVLTEEGPRSTIPVPVTRTVRVRSGLPEKYAKKVEFVGASFGDGETVKARAELKLGDKPVPDARVLVAAQVDGREWPVVLKAELMTGTDGRAAFEFPLPRRMVRGDVRLKVTFEPADGSRPEAVARPVPITGKEVVVEFFPEGGELVAGVPCKVYVRATTPAGQPVDVSGAITDGTETVARVETTTDADEPGANRGIGAVTFTPKANTAYTLKLERPATNAVLPLPAVKAGGVTMHVLDPVTAPGQPVRVELRSPDRPRSLLVGAYTRGRLADTQRVEVKPGDTAVVELLTGNDPRGGVTRVTVFDDSTGTPVAERLVFRKPGERLNLSYAAKPGPDGRVDLTVSATDEGGKAVPAVVWVAAVNSAVAPGPRDRLLPTHFLLAGEVQTPDQLEHADFLLTDRPNAAEALDRVLATQGWRRFAEQKPAVDLTQKRTAFLDHERLQVLNGQYHGGAESSADRDHQRVAGYWTAYEEAVAWLEQAQRAKEAVEADRSWEPAYRRVREEMAARRPEVADRLGALRAAAEPLSAVRKVAWAAVGALVVLGGGFAVASARGRRPLGLAALGALGLAAYLLATDAGIAARLAAVIPGTPADAEPDLTQAAPAPGPDRPPIEVVPRPGGPVVTNRGSVVPPPAVAPTNAANTGPRGPAARVIDDRQVVLDPRPRIPNEDIHRTGPRFAPRGPVPPSDEFVRRAAEEKAAAARHAADRWRAIGERMAGAVSAPKGAAVLGHMLASVPKTPPLVVREYAAPRPAPAAPPDHEPDTVLWQPVLVLADGTATVSFHAGAAPGGYQILVGGHTLDGRLGAVRGVLPAVPPAPVPPK